MRKSVFVLFLACLSIGATAQEDRFFMPEEIQQAYEKGTRSWDGTPGPNYWQNQVDYDIEAEVDPATRTLTGSETITFYNNSPDELSTIIIRLYQDVFRKGNERSIRVRPSDVNDGMIISKLMVDGTEIDMEEGTRRSGSNMFVEMPNSLKSQGSATIEVDWTMVIPETTRRMGAYDSTSYFVSYWYPQVAVYDDIFGWDALAYDFSTEFYNNIGNFNVSITAPTNFTVVATGVLQNAKEVFQKKHYKLYQEAYKSTETVNIITAADIEEGVNHKSGTWEYQAEKVTDFSFCLSDHFAYDAAIQEVDGRDVLNATYYNINMDARRIPAAKNLTAVQQKSMDKMSTEMPGVPYPYPEFTTCVMGIGGGGMETPMMANNGQPGTGVTIHEMFHTYFPMYVRVNEKRFAWMDEGWASFNDEYIETRYFDEDTSQFITDYANLTGTLGSISDLPLITSTQFMDDSNYGYASYPLPAFIYTMLHHHLGEELFRQCYKTYIERWAEKSPTPYDFFYSFEDVSGQDLSWLWKPWFFSYGNVDVAIKSFENGTLTISSGGNRPIPIVVSASYEDGTSFRKDMSAAIWKDQSEITIDIPNSDAVTDLSVNESMPDADIMDNYYPTLKERMANYEIDKNMLGTYQINEYNITATIQEDDGLIKVIVGAVGMSTYFMPQEDGSFKSLDSNFIYTVDREGEQMNMKMQIKSWGLTLTGSK